jgi:hypothetical protein
MVNCHRLTKLATSSFPLSAAPSAFFVALSNGGASALSLPAEQEPCLTMRHWRERYFPTTAYYIGSRDPMCGFKLSGRRTVGTKPDGKNNVKTMV